MNGIKISRKGKSVDDARSDDIVLNSSLETMPVHQEDDFSIFVTPTTGLYWYYISIPHTLGYKPRTMGWIDSVDARGKPTRRKMYAQEGLWRYFLYASDTRLYLIAGWSNALTTPTGSPFKKTGHYFIFSGDMSKI